MKSLQYTHAQNFQKFFIIQQDILANFEMPPGKDLSGIRDLQKAEIGFPPKKSKDETNSLNSNYSELF